jgi:hypothetical protein
MDEARRDAFAERLFGATVGALDLLHVYVGDRLGLYSAMADGKPLTAEELATKAGSQRSPGLWSGSTLIRRRVWLMSGAGRAGQASPSRAVSQR